MILRNGFGRYFGPALLAVGLLATPALAELPAPQLSGVSPAMESTATAPVTELRFDYVDEVHLFNVQMVTIIDERTQSFTLFAADGAYLRGNSFVFPLQQPLTRDGVYRIQVMAQAIDNGQSLSNSYEFTIGAPDAPTE